MIVWEHGQGELHMYAVAVELDSVCDMCAMKHIKSVNTTYRLPHKNIDQQILVLGYRGAYSSKDGELKDVIYYDNARNINMLFLADRGSQSAIIGYRYYDKDDGQNHICTTWESNEWWAEPEPNFIKCFCSIECMFNLL